MRKSHQVTVTLTLFLALLLAGLPMPQAWALGWQTVSASRLSAMLNEQSGVWTVDVRGAKAFAERHIEGSMNIPLSLLGAKKFPPRKTIVLVDDSLGLKNAAEAAKLLESKVASQLYVLEGGLAGWQNERLPLATRGGEGMLQVTPDELAWARSSGVAFRLYDLRDPSEQQLYPVEGALPVKGETSRERLKQLKELLIAQQRQSLGKKLEGVNTAVLVLPMMADLKEQLQDLLFGMTADVRYLEGGYAAWMARPQAQLVTDPSGRYCSQSERGEEKR